jgi:hypothetical protein
MIGTLVIVFGRHVPIITYCRLNQGAATQPPDSAALGSATTAGFPATPVTSGGINRRSRWAAREMYRIARIL